MPPREDLLEETGGYLLLPMIKNAKRIDPRRPDSPAVFQLETAMGAAIECFDGATAVVVPRSRLAPVKTTSDLFALRSDAYVVTPDWQVTLAPECGGIPPTVTLDENHYKAVDQLDARTAAGATASIVATVTPRIANRLMVSSARRSAEYVYGFPFFPYSYSSTYTYPYTGPNRHATGPARDYFFSGFSTEIAIARW